MNDNPICFGSTADFLLVIFIKHAQDRWIQNGVALLKGVLVFPVLLLVVLPPHLIISERGTHTFPSVDGNVCVRGELLTL